MARAPIDTARAHVDGDRSDGHGRSADGMLEVDLRRPIEMGVEVALTANGVPVSP